MQMSPITKKVMVPNANGKKELNSLNARSLLQSSKHSVTSNDLNLANQQDVLHTLQMLPCKPDKLGNRKGQGSLQPRKEQTKGQRHPAAERLLSKLTSPVNHAVGDKENFKPTNPSRPLP